MGVKSEMAAESPSWGTPRSLRECFQITVMPFLKFYQNPSTTIQHTHTHTEEKKEREEKKENSKHLTTSLLYSGKETSTEHQSNVSLCTAT